MKVSKVILTRTIYLKLLNYVVKRKKLHREKKENAYRVKSYHEMKIFLFIMPVLCEFKTEYH